MRDLVKYIVKEIADTDDVEIIEEETQTGGIVMTIIMDKDSIGKIIGKHGKIANALRSIVKAAALKSKNRYDVVIKEKSE